MAVSVRQQYWSPFLTSAVMLT